VPIYGNIDLEKGVTDADGWTGLKKPLLKLLRAVFINVKYCIDMVFAMLNNYGIVSCSYIFCHTQIYAYRLEGN
jgi:hypothetical protein